MDDNSTDDTAAVVSNQPPERGTLCQTVLKSAVAFVSIDGSDRPAAQFRICTTGTLLSGEAVAIGLFLGGHTDVDACIHEFTLLSLLLVFVVL